MCLNRDKATARDLNRRSIALLDKVSAVAFDFDGANAQIPVASSGAIFGRLVRFNSKRNGMSN